MKVQSNFVTGVVMLQAILLLSQTNLLANSLKCNTGFMRAFCMKGRKDSRFGSVEMCAGIKNSCCTQEDQMVMYGSWISGKTEEKISHRYQTLNVVYDALLAQLKIVHEFAKKVEDLLRLKKFSNCKFLANRITSYRLPTVEASLKSSLESMGTFFTNSYKGIYCSMCNADNHKFILDKKASLVLNEDTCRAMTEKTLGPLLYLHVHLNKYINLVTKFMSSCDFRGDYEMDLVMPKEFLFTADEPTKKSLGECKIYRNTKQWLVYCKDVCERFSIGKFDPFFEPNRIKVARYVVFLKRLIAQYVRKEKSMPLFNTNIDGGSSGGESGSGSDGKDQSGQSGKGSGRLLESGSSGSGHGQKGNDKDANNKDQNNNNNNNNNQNGDPNDPNNENNGNKKDKMLDLIKSMESEKEVTTFKFDTSAPIAAGSFKSIYKRSGIDLILAADASVFEEGVFNQVKTIVNLQRLAKTSAGELTAEQRQMLAASGADKMTVFAVMVVGLLFSRLM